MPRTIAPPVNDALDLALRALALHLVARVPELTDRIRPAGANLSDEGEPPWLAIRPTGVRVDSWLSPAEEVDVTSAKNATGGPGGQITVCVGEFAGGVELILSVNQPSARASFQAAILGAFFGAGGDDEDEDDRHGLVVLPLGTVYPAGGDNATAYEATCSFALDGAGEWDEEKAFISDRRVVLPLQVSAPLLVNRRVPGTIEEITIARTGDMETAAESVPVSSYLVAEDGTLTNA